MSDLKQYVSENLFKVKETEQEMIMPDAEYEVTNVSSGEILRMTGKEFVGMFGERDAMAALKGESNSLNAIKVEPNA